MNYDVTESKLFEPLISLKVLYKNMPESTGCEKCEEVNGSNAFWCCRTQSPSMYYVEFIYIWQHINKTFSKIKKHDLIIRSIKNYLTSEKNKGCVFFDNECTCYEYRPFICRMYGSIPDENWNKRWEALKQEQGDSFDSHPQCNLVTTVGDKITAEEENKWFSYISFLEHRIGVPSQVVKMHDQNNGSYRTFHDHIVLEIIPADILSKLTELKVLNLNNEQIDEFVNSIMKNLI